ncbi:Ribosome biogenesis protein BOP1 [Symbiodinium microadriaticum]|uniref:Ribosome biogenesis protein BOP1 homolog n=1 Tax=Symbiodinium microadriaticum TaxID=2951 RepID=A0A1Q9EAM3_SYMMI|nr:Ribosome biogenesis protein BOP1 [Symbiodinium microadriaticum]
MPLAKQKPRVRKTRSPSASSRVKKRRVSSKGAAADEPSPPPASEGNAAPKTELDAADLEDTDDESESDGLVDDGSSDDSEDDAPRNRIGNVPLEWYKDEDHVGYDIAGEKVMRTLSTGEIDALLESKDNPDAWRTVKDHKNQREVVLTDTDLEIIRRIRSRMYPSAATDTTEMVEFDNPEARIHPERKAHPPKARFLPSKWERMKVKRLVALLREGKIRPPPPPAPEVFDLWADEPETRRRRAPPPLPAPKMALPGHAESYNPPPEYLFTEEEKKEWEETFEEERAITHLPQKYDALRRVPGYKDFIVERFKRCLDLYLVPRALKQRMNVDPESLLPKLPSPKDLRPFPTHIAVAYEGHSGMVRAVAVEATGRYLATASSDETLRIWEVATGRPIRSLKFSSSVTAVAWNPRHLLLSVAAEENVFFVDPGLQLIPKDTPEEAEELPATVTSMLEFKEAAGVKPVSEGNEDEEANEGAKARAVRWHRVEPDSDHYKVGCRLSIATDGDVQFLVWHHKGNYCAAVSPKARATSNQCIIHALNQQKSMRPFAKLRGGQQVQSCAFHPTKHFGCLMVCLKDQNSAEAAHQWCQVDLIGHGETDTIYAGDLKLHVERILRREKLVPETSFHIRLVFNGKVLRDDAIISGAELLDLQLPKMRVSYMLPEDYDWATADWLGPEEPSVPHTFRFVGPTQADPEAAEEYEYLEEQDEQNSCAETEELSESDCESTLPTTPIPGCGHPTGDHVVVGSYDRRVVWWDLDFAKTPYKTLQYHDKAVRCATFHPGRFPLLAACSDDATVSILHAKVFSDLMQSPMIVPVKRLRDHMVNQGFGVLACAWHPHQPWLFTAGSDGRVYLWA